MSKEMREQIDRVKNWKQFLNENKNSENEVVSFINKNKKIINRVVNFETNFYRSLFLVLSWWGLHFLILFLVF